MILPAEKNKIIKVLGKHYAGAILKHLAEKKIVNTDGGEYSRDSIHKFVSGKQANELVELEIIKLVAKVKAERKEAEKLKKEVLR